MKRLIVAAGPKARQSVEVMGPRGVPTIMVKLGRRVPIGPEHYEHFHFKSLLKKSMLVVVGEESDPGPKPKPPPSLRHKRKPKKPVDTGLLATPAPKTDTVTKDGE